MTISHLKLIKIRPGFPVRLQAAGHGITRVWTPLDRHDFSGNTYVPGDSTVTFHYGHTIMSDSSETTAPGHIPTPGRTLPIDRCDIIKFMCDDVGLYSTVRVTVAQKTGFHELITGKKYKAERLYCNGTGQNLDGYQIEHITKVYE